MRSQFDEQLASLHKELITIGALCENAIATSAKALHQGDVALAGSVFDDAAQIAQKERDIETMCIWKGSEITRPILRNGYCSPFGGVML